MGRPFVQELTQIPTTIKWANELNICKLQEIIGKYNHPVYVVGSGGSYSACVYAADLLTSKGVFAKAVTPLELFYSRSSIRKGNLLFISASGNNTDILFAFKKAIESEPVSIVSICMRRKTKLAALSSNYSACTTFEFDSPSGKDGFLATNSLVAYFVILHRAIIGQKVEEFQKKAFESAGIRFIRDTVADTCFTVLYGSHHHAVAIDLESKLSEAGLSPSLLSDYRHFAHGRHQWFDKRKNSAVIALVGPADKKLSEKTLGLLPVTIPRLILNTTTDHFSGTIPLLLQSMEFIRLYGEKQGIDPGRPGVPDYGSKIYHLKYERLVDSMVLNTFDAAIARKAKVDSVGDLEPEVYKIWKKRYIKFVKRLSATKFGSLIFDYDGTLCSAANRFEGMGKEVSSSLIKFVKRGFVVGIISGRGQSLRKDLEKVFKSEPQLMKNVVVGYYNGSDIAPLSDSKHPFKDGAIHTSLKKIIDHLAILGIKGDKSPNQLTFGSKTTKEWSALRDMLINEIMLLDFEDITLVESSHSLDIIPRKIASKNHIVYHCAELCRLKGLPSTSLCIGDKGQWPGNDFALLANEFALSVGDVSPVPETGWNLCPPGLRDEKATTYLFDKIKYKKGYFTMNNV